MLSICNHFFYYSFILLQDFLEIHEKVNLGIICRKKIILKFAIDDESDNTKEQGQRSKSLIG